MVFFMPGIERVSFSSIDHDRHPRREPAPLHR
jgi:hypothetical protein